MGENGIYRKTVMGRDEIATRANKLGMRERTMLIMVDDKTTRSGLLSRSAHPSSGDILDSLLARGFIEILSGPIHAAAEDKAAFALSQAPAGSFSLDHEIIVSEAKFLLINFCVDNFGTQSQSLVDEIRACSRQQDVVIALGKVLAAVRKQCPSQLPLLLKLIREINATA
jgi:hypothetical protein